MLSAAVLLIALCSGPAAGHPQANTNLSKKVVAAAKSYGWQQTTESLPPVKEKHALRERFQIGPRVLDISVAKDKSVGKLRFHAPKGFVVMEEPLLTKLKVYVPDYSTKRLASMKAYAAGEMVIKGELKDRHRVLISLKFNGAFIAPEPIDQQEAIYDDVIAIAKLLTQELERR